MGQQQDADVDCQMERLGRLEATGRRVRCALGQRQRDAADEDRDSDHGEQPRLAPAGTWPDGSEDAG